MPIVMQCPFFKRDGTLKVYCEGGTVKFPDARARRDYIVELCANSVHWHKCSICKCLENYYDRKEKE